MKLFMTQMPRLRAFALRKLLRYLVDLAGIEPATSSMPFPSTKFSCEDSERHRAIQTGSVHAALVAVGCLARVIERYPPTYGDAGRDDRVMTQTRTQMREEQNYRQGRTRRSRSKQKRAVPVLITLARR